MRLLLILITLCASLPALALELDGKTGFARVLPLNSSISARVAEMRVTAGQAVAAGELLLRLDDTALRARRDAAAAEVDALIPGVEQSRIEFEKAQELFDRDSLALVELDRAERELRAAEARLAAANSSLALAEYRLLQAELRSPIDGVVLEVKAFPGQFINTRVSDPVLLTLADDHNMTVRVLAPLESLGQELADRPAKMTYRGKTYAGRVVEVGREITTSGNDHPAIGLKVLFRTEGEVPAGLSVRIDID